MQEIALAGVVGNNYCHGRGTFLGSFEERSGTVNLEFQARAQPCLSLDGSLVGPRTSPVITFAGKYPRIEKDIYDFVDL